MQPGFNEIDPAPARHFIAEAGLIAFEGVARTMAHGARRHLARLEAACFKCDTEGLSVTAHALASLLAQFGFVTLSKRITIYEFAPHYLRRSTFAELNQRLEAGIEELERLIECERQPRPPNAANPYIMMAVGQRPLDALHPIDRPIDLDQSGCAKSGIHIHAFK